MVEDTVSEEGGCARGAVDCNWACFLAQCVGAEPCQAILQSAKETVEASVRERCETEFAGCITGLPHIHFLSKHMFSLKVFFVRITRNN